MDKHTREVFGLMVRKNSHKDIRCLKQQAGPASIHGNKFWKSTTLMLDYLEVNPPMHNTRILEIGCGWGISSIYCAKYYQSHMTALDADEAVFPFLDYHAELNGVQVSKVKARYDKLTKAMLSEFDMVIASDICFWDEMVEPLFKLIGRCYQAGVQRVTMTDPGRQPFRDVAELCVEKYDTIYDNWSVPHPNNFSGLVLDIA